MQLKFRHLPLSPSELVGGSAALAVVALVALFGLGLVKIPSLPGLPSVSIASVQLPGTGSSGGQPNAQSDSKKVAPEQQTYRLASGADDQSAPGPIGAKMSGSGIVYAADGNSSDRARRGLRAQPAVLTPARAETAVSTPPETGRSPLNRSDAMWIQERLRELGYFSGNPDGVWNAASRNALHDFKSLNGLSPDERWDKEAEQRLSSGEGIRADDTFIGSWATDVDQCQQGRGHGAPIVITSRTAETGSAECSFRTITREVATWWRVTAMCSAGRNSWNANMQLRLTTPNLTFDRMLEPAKEATRVGNHTDIEYARFTDDLVISTEQGTGRYVRCPAP